MKLYPGLSVIEPHNIQIQKTGAKGIAYVSKPLPASDLERSKDVLSLMGAGKAALRGRSQEATIAAWLKSARQSGSSTIPGARRVWRISTSVSGTTYWHDSYRGTAKDSVFSIVCR